MSFDLLQPRNKRNKLILSFQMTSSTILRDIRFLGKRTRLWTTSSSLDKVIIFLHGSGDTAFGFEKWLRDVRPQGPPSNVGVILPSAPMRPYLLNGGELSSVWHQRKDLDINSDFEDIHGIDEICLGLTNLMNDIKNAGISDITVGGFSMGGHVALHSVFRKQLAVNKCFALSSFLIHKSAVYDSINRGSNVLLYLAHGDSDALVSHKWAQNVAEKMESFNVETYITIYKGVGHEITSGIISDVFTWAVDRDKT